jgi:hypothetical protein
LALHLLSSSSFPSFNATARVLRILNGTIIPESHAFFQVKMKH